MFLQKADFDQVEFAIKKLFVGKFEEMDYIWLAVDKIMALVVQIISKS